MPKRDVISPQKMLAKKYQLRFLEEGSEGNCLEMYKLALFLLCRFLHFRLRYAAITGIISRVFW